MVSVGDGAGGLGTAHLGPANVSTLNIGKTIGVAAALGSASFDVGGDRTLAGTLTCFDLHQIASTKLARSP